MKPNFRDRGATSVEIGGGGGGGISDLMLEGRGTRHFFLLIFYNFKNIAPRFLNLNKAYAQDLGQVFVKSCFIDHVNLTYMQYSNENH